MSGGKASQLQQIPQAANFKKEYQVDNFKTFLLHHQRACSPQRVDDSHEPLENFRLAVNCALNPWHGFEDVEKENFLDLGKTLFLLTKPGIILL